MKIPIEISARHIHLCQKDIEALFGKDHQLKKIKQLTQPSDFCAEEQISLRAGDREIKNVRVVGPSRKKTQVEISKTDAYLLGVNPPLRLSGDLNGSVGIVLIGPAGEVELKEGLIIAKRHIHCSIAEAKKLGLKNNAVISVKIEGERGGILDNIIVRTSDDYNLCVHLDTDEANAMGIDKSGKGEIL